MLPIQAPKAQPCRKCADTLDNALIELDRRTRECKKRNSVARDMARRSAAARVYAARMNAIDCRFGSCANSVKQ